MTTTTNTKDALQAAHNALMDAEDANRDGSVQDAIAIARNAISLAMSLSRKAEG
jgi:DNA-directed RNA polymerase beta' subunit